MSTITFGLNETIKRLERTLLDLEISVDALIAGYEHFPFAKLRADDLVPTAPPPRTTTMTPLVDASRFGTPPPPQLKIVFVCIEDINPRELVEHIPRYVSSWNALLARSRARLEEWVIKGAGDEEERRRKMKRLVDEREMWLVPLEKGSEQVLAHDVGLRRVGVMGITVSSLGLKQDDHLPKHKTQIEFPTLERIANHLKSTTLVPPIPPFPIHPTAPTRATSIYAPTILKALHTTTPADPKSRKAERIAAVRSARERQKRTRAEQVEKTRRTLGWKVGGRFVGGSEQKSRDRKARWEKATRVKDKVKARQRKKVVKEKVAEKRKVATIPGG